MVGVFDGAQDGFEVGAFDGPCDGTKVGAFEGAELGCVVGARVGAMVQIEHAAFPHIDLFLHVQRLALHFSSAQLQAPFTYHKKYLFNNTIKLVKYSVILYNEI
jgi:hypothetical protein